MNTVSEKLTLTEQIIGNDDTSNERYKYRKWTDQL